MQAIATVALQLGKASYDTISGFRSQRQDVVDIQSDLSVLAVVLVLIRTQAKGVPNDRRLEPLREPLSCCRHILQDIHETLAQCTKHAKSHRESIRTWLSLQYHDKSFIEAKQRMPNYKVTQCSAFDAMNMYVFKASCCVY